VAAGLSLGVEGLRPIPLRPPASPGYLFPGVTAVFLVVVGAFVVSRKVL
jgi:hypothetical protein